MRYKVAGFLLLALAAFNIYAIIQDFVQDKTPEPFYYYLLIFVALVTGIYFLFIQKRR
jgi:hypothetical protein